MTSYVALLRGINVGGNKKVPMADLKKVLETMGYKNVKTLLASGNVLFDSSEKKPATLRKDIEAALEKKFGFTVPTIIRTKDEIEKLIKTDPFAGIKVTPETRLYITFRGEPIKKHSIKIPYKDPEFEYQITKVTDGEVCSYLTVSGDRGSVDAMGILEKEFSKNVTTRNWNTVLKLVA